MAPSFPDRLSPCQRRKNVWYNRGMTPKLTHELHQALVQRPGQPLEVEDPVTHARYVLVQIDVYERLQQAMDYDASEPDPRHG